mmetsp:Transcript_12693/g.32462  ORF Transcript_12693/g.32462 Transcript_12693/m.32462 type:complete len:285 (+) Transcript_12693:2622-3476(+)
MAPNMWYTSCCTGDKYRRWQLLYLTCPRTSRSGNHPYMCRSAYSSHTWYRNHPDNQPHLNESHSLLDIDDRSCLTDLENVCPHCTWRRTSRLDSIACTMSTNLGRGLSTRPRIVNCTVGRRWSHLRTLMNHSYQRTLLLGCDFGMKHNWQGQVHNRLGSKLRSDSKVSRRKGYYTACTCPLMPCSSRLDTAPRNFRSTKHGGSEYTHGHQPLCIRRYTRESRRSIDRLPHIRATCRIVRRMCRRATRSHTLSRLVRTKVGGNPEHSVHCTHGIPHDTEHSFCSE